jgi:hypothetical protein
MIGLPANCEAFLVRCTGLLDVYIDIFDRSANADRFVLRPTGVRISDQSIAGIQGSTDRTDTFDIDVWIAADFQLKSAVALGAIASHILCHLFGSLL